MYRLFSLGVDFLGTVRPSLPSRPDLRTECGLSTGHSSWRRFESLEPVLQKFTIRPVVTLGWQAKSGSVKVFKGREKIAVLPLPERWGDVDAKIGVHADQMCVIGRVVQR